MLRKTLCLLLCALLLWSTALADARTPYELLDAAFIDNEACEDSDEQMAVGAKYIMLLTEQIARVLDPQGLLAPEIDRLMADVASADARCRDAAQHAANHLYAAADLLACAATSLDDGSHAAAIQAAQAHLYDFCFSSQDQHATAAEAIYGLTAVIADELDVSGDWHDTLLSIQAQHDDTLHACRSNLHRTANALYSTVDMLTVIAYQLDIHSSWATSIGNVQNNLHELNATCTTSFHQCINGCFRCMELVAIIAIELQ